MKKDSILEKYENDGFGKNTYGWYFNPWTDEYDPEYDPHNDKEYNVNINNNSEETENRIKEEKKIEEETKEKKNEEKNHQKVTQIIISPIEGKLIYRYDDTKYNLYGWKAEGSDIDYKDNKISKVIEILKGRFSTEAISNIEGAIDPNIIEFIHKNNKEIDIGIHDYIKFLQGQPGSFNIVYDLRNIYDSDLDHKQIESIMGISKKASKLNQELVVVKKDNIIKRLLGKVKKRISQKERKRIKATETNSKKLNTKIVKPKVKSFKNKYWFNKKEEARTEESLIDTEIFDELMEEKESNMNKTGSER